MFIAVNLLNIVISQENALNFARVINTNWKLRKPLYFLSELNHVTESVNEKPPD